jgi:hypothetical protein
VTGVAADTVKTVHDVVASTLLDPVLMSLSVIGRAYPLPAGLSTAAAEPTTTDATQPAGPTSAERTAQLVERLMTPAYHLGPPALAQPSPDAARTAVAEATTWRPAEVAAESPVGSTAGSTAGISAEAKFPQVDFNAGIGSEAEFVAAGGSAYSALREAALAISKLGAIIPFGVFLPDTLIRIHDNTIHCAQPDQFVGTILLPGRTGSALVVFDGTQSQTSSVIVDANDILANAGDGTDKDPVPVASVTNIFFATVTGNQIRQLDHHGNSFSLTGTENAAITGNMMAGFAILPAKPDPAPLNSWYPFNRILT